MNYAQTISFIREVCLAHPLVNSFYEGDIYQINADSNIQYPAVVLTPNSHNNDEFFTNFNFNLFFVDRLTSDRRNKVSVQSAAITALKQIMNQLLFAADDSIDVDYPYPVNVFTERFSDECAGSFVVVNFMVPSDISLCSESIATIPDDLVDTSDGTITPVTVIAGEIGYARGRRVVGTLDISDAISEARTEGIAAGRAEVFEEQSDATITPEGVYLGEIGYGKDGIRVVGTLDPGDNYDAGFADGQAHIIELQADATITPDDILIGKVGYGANNTRVVGTISPSRPAGKIGIFYIDYDGTPVATFWIDRGGNFTGTAPEGPDHSDMGWTFEGWNWQPKDLTNLYVDQYVMPAYVAADGATEFELEVNSMTAPAGTLQFRVQGVTAGTTIDYGDGTTDTLTAGSHTIQHFYNTGVYRGRIVSLDNAPYIIGSGGVNFIGGNGTPAEARQALTGIIIGKNVTITTGACQRSSLRWVVLNNSVISDGSFLSNTFTLKYLGLPSSFIEISGNFANNCRSLRVASLPPGVSSLGTFPFWGCPSLSNDNNVKLATELPSQIHQDNYSLEMTYIGQSVTVVNPQAFINCGNLRNIIIACEIVPTLTSINAFTGINPLCRFWVNDAIYDALKLATNWSAYAAYMYKLSEYANS